MDCVNENMLQRGANSGIKADNDDDSAAPFSGIRVGTRISQNLLIRKQDDNDM